jgi:hypothetical protein
MLMKKQHARFWRNSDLFLGRAPIMGIEDGLAALAAIGG